MSWNKIDNLLKKTEAFYKKALWANFLTQAQDTNNAEPNYSGGYVSPDDSPESEEPSSLAPESIAQPGEDLGLYSEIKSFARDVTNPDIAEEIELIGELYKKSLREGKGFAYVANAINNLVGNSIPDNYPEDEEDLDEDAPETPESILKKERDAIERLMTRVYTDFKQRAVKAGIDIKKKDDPNVARQMHDFKNAYLQKKEEQLASKLGPGAAERDLTSEEIEELREGGGYDTSLDRSDIAGKREREDGGTPGMSVRQGYNPKDWAAFYKGEIDRYNDELRSSTDITIKTNIQEMIKVLEGLYKLTQDEALLLESITWTIRPKTDVSPRQKVIDQPELRDTYDRLKTAQKELRKKRVALNTRLRSYRAGKENQNLATQISASSSPKEKILLEQKKLLNDLIMSTDKRKSLELKRRKQLVKSLGGDIDPEEVAKDPELILPSYPKAQLDKDLAKIEEASKLKISAYDANVEQAENIKKEFIYDKKTRIGPLSVEGVFIQFKQSLPSIKMGIKKKITAQLRESENTDYKPYKDAISSALQSGDKTAIALAEKALQKQLNNDAEKHPAIQSFIAYSESFYKYIEELKALQKAESSSGENVLLSGASLDVIKKLMEEGKKLLTLEMSRSPGKHKGPSKLAEALTTIVRELNDRLQNSPKQTEGFNKMNLQQKLAALKEYLKKQDELQKNSNENTDNNFYAGTTEELPIKPEPTGAVSKAEADEYAHQVFENLLNNLKIKGLDF